MKIFDDLDWFKEGQTVSMQLTRKQCEAKNYCSIALGELGRVLKTEGNKVLVQFKGRAQWVNYNEVI